jgi:hypothetical protein
MDSDAAVFRLASPRYQARRHPDFPSVGLRSSENPSSTKKNHAVETSDDADRARLFSSGERRARQERRRAGGSLTVSFQEADTEGSNLSLADLAATESSKQKKRERASQKRRKFEEPVELSHMRSSSSSRGSRGSSRSRRDSVTEERPIGMATLPQKAPFFATGRLVHSEQGTLVEEGGEESNFGLGTLADAQTTLWARDEDEGGDLSHYSDAFYARSGGSSVGAGVGVGGGDNGDGDGDDDDDDDDEFVSRSLRSKSPIRAAGSLGRKLPARWGDIVDVGGHSVSPNLSGSRALVRGKFDDRPAVHVRARDANRRSDIANAQKAKSYGVRPRRGGANDEVEDSSASGRGRPRRALHDASWGELWAASAKRSDDAHSAANSAVWRLFATMLLWLAAWLLRGPKTLWRKLSH